MENFKVDYGVVCHHEIDVKIDKWNRWLIHNGQWKGVFCTSQETWVILWEKNMILKFQMM